MPSPLKIDKIALKKKYSSLKMDTIIVIKQKTLAKQRGNKGYDKLRKVELIQKLEAHPDVNEQVLITGLETPRGTTRAVITSVILDDPILDDKTPVLQPSQILLLKACKRSKFWLMALDYIPPKPRVVDDALKSFKNLIKKLYNKRDFLPIERVKICVENVCDTLSDRRKRWD